MVLELSRIIETSTHGAAQLGEQLLKLQRNHERVVGVKFLPTKLSTGHFVVKVAVKLNGKSTMTEDQARQWFAHKTTSWLNGYAVFELEEVQCSEL